MDELRSILNNYWGYPEFQGKQREIIDSILENKDTLAIMPTGGGKSICFQVPAIYMGKTCLVISPLIALMKDQVDALISRGIKASTVFSGMNAREIDISLDNAIHNPPNLLYVSPERLQNHLFRERLKQMEIGLVAVDEAHCISQWGHDFRPSYLQIAEIRDLMQERVPMIALTASATPRVQNDILRYLDLSNPNLIKTSAKRKNLSLSCYRESDKMGRVIKALQNVPGSTLIYVRNRRKTKELANDLNSMGFSSTYFHAGLARETKFKHQENWKSGKTRIMVCTNAFGMGIDKSDVRLVIHYDLPDSIEAYYQEVGRAGRDGKLAFGLLVYNEPDIDSINELSEAKYPDLEFVIKCYNAIGNHYKLALGSGESQVFDFPIEKVCHSFDLNALELIRAISLLEKMDFLSYLISQNWSSTVHILLDPKELYRFQVENREDEPLIKSLLRNYGGELYSQYVSVDEDRLSKISGIGLEEIKTRLKALRKRKILDYHQSKAGPKLIFQVGRSGDSSLKEAYRNIIQKEKEAFNERSAAALNFYEEESKCRMNQIQSYFGESPDIPCGKCDNCIKQNKKGEHSKELENAMEELKTLLSTKETVTMEEITRTASKRSESIILEALRLYLNSGHVGKNGDGHFYLTGKN